jgi:4-hydroxy-3-methylbut-2-enyl diphosphate reductase
VDDIEESWLDSVESIGLSSGASTPEILVQRVVDYLKSRGDAEISTLQVAREDVTFRLPPQLADLAPA